MAKILGSSKSISSVSPKMTSKEYRDVWRPPGEVAKRSGAPNAEGQITCVSRRSPVPFQPSSIAFGFPSSPIAEVAV